MASCARRRLVRALGLRARGEARPATVVAVWCGQSRSKRLSKAWRRPSRRRRRESSSWRRDAPAETRERQTIERDLEVRYDTKARWIDVALVSSGLALTSAGIITLVDSGKVAPRPHQRTRLQSRGRGAAVAIGSGLVIGGVALGTIAAIDFFRMGRVTRRTETVSREASRGREGRLSYRRRR